MSIWSELVALFSFKRLFFVLSKNRALKMSDTATKELVDTLSDPEEPLTPEVEEAAINVAGVLKNVLKYSSFQSRGSRSAPSEPLSSKVQKQLLK